MPTFILNEHFPIKLDYLPDKQKFEYVLIVRFGDDFELEKIIQLDWKMFIKYKRWHKTMNAWNISITKALEEEADILFEK